MAWDIPGQTGNGFFFVTNGGEWGSSPMSGDVLQWYSDVGASDGMINDKITYTQGETSGLPLNPGEDWAVGQTQVYTPDLHKEWELSYDSYFAAVDIINGSGNFEVTIKIYNQVGYLLEFVDFYP